MILLVAVSSYKIRLPLQLSTHIHTQTICHKSHNYPTSVIPGMLFGHEKKRRKKKKQHVVWWTLIIYKVQLCHLVLRYPKPSYSLPCCALVQSTQPCSRVLCKLFQVLVGNIHLKKLQTTDALQHYELKNKKTKKKTVTQVNWSMSSGCPAFLKTRERNVQNKHTAPFSSA